MQIGNRFFDVENETYVCGILNVTPDSFSDGGRYAETDAAMYRAEQMILEGAALIDVGGESTRPGFEPVSVETECERVIPVIEKIKNTFDIPVSVDTSKSAVAREALLAGADVGAAMGSGADAAIEAADAVFMTSSVESIPEAITIAKSTNRIAIQNVVFALAVKVAVMILGLCGHANMWMAVFADTGVAMICVMNSIRVLYKK